ncbi:MAG: hypothetical protein ACHQFW_10855 [Chitinophagales bacterium]
MKRIVVFASLLIGTQVYAQQMRIGPMAFTEMQSFVDEVKINTDITATVETNSQQLVTTSINNFGNNAASEIIITDENTTSGVVVQEDLVAGRAGEGNNLFRDVFQKLRSFIQLRIFNKNADRINN